MPSPTNSISRQRQRGRARAGPDGLLGRSPIGTHNGITVAIFDSAHAARQHKVTFMDGALAAWQHRRLAGRLPRRPAPRLGSNDGGASGGDYISAGTASTAPTGTTWGRLRLEFHHIIQVTAACDADVCRPRSVSLSDSSSRLRAPPAPALDTPATNQVRMVFW